jgi:hypothetical protein
MSDMSDMSDMPKHIPIIAVLFALSAIASAQQSGGGGGGTGGGGSGTVTSVSVTSANGVSGSVATPTTTPAITLTLGAITPSSIVDTGITSTPSTAPICPNGTGGLFTTSGCAVGTGTVTSVTFTGDGIVDSSTPSSAVTASGTVTATPLTQSANTVLAGPSTGSAANPAFRALVAADVPACPTCVTSAASLTSTALMTGAGSQGAQTPSATATLSSGGNMALPGTISVGSSAPACTFGTGGSFCSAEGTASTAAASQDIVYGDSTYHQFMASQNDFANAASATFFPVEVDAINTQTANYSMVPQDGTILCNKATAMTITLISSGIPSGKTVHIKNINTGTCTVDGVAIDNYASGTGINLGQYQSVTLRFDGTQYWLF